MRREESTASIRKGGRMSNETLILKNPRGWFAAGAEVQKAMGLLSDGAFRLFIYLCLNARRDSGVLEGSLTQLAKNVKRGKHTLRLYLREMETAGICHSRFSHSPLGDGVVEVTEDPYQDRKTGFGSCNFAAIRKMLKLGLRKYILSAADEILAREWLIAASGLTLNGRF
jgi:hypothetical protein